MLELELKNSLDFSTPETTAKSLELATIGMQEIKNAVTKALENYNADNYTEDNIADAKRDKADLNNASKALNAKRLELERGYMERFNKFKDLTKETCAIIADASGKIDAIIKAVDQREKDAKKAEIRIYFDSKMFTLVPLEKIFDIKWLNKSAKLAEIKKEIDAKIDKIFADLQTLDTIHEEELKPMYLDTLDISATIARGREIKENRERLEREKKEAMNRKLEIQGKAEVRELNQNIKTERVEDLVEQATGQPIEEEILTFTLRFHGTRKKLFELKQFMTENQITYEKL